jgi:hypothetical protein
MDHDFYLEKFNNSATQLDKKLLKDKQLEISVGIILDSVYLKLYKKKWLNDSEQEINAKTKIFFSIWVNDKTLKENKIFYNIHALKLRHLRDHSISSRDFAEKFRRDFKKIQQHWENISLNFGPLTLMEGWSEIHTGDIETIIVSLANNFLTIDHIIDKTLARFEN